MQPGPMRTGMSGHADLRAMEAASRTHVHGDVGPDTAPPPQPVCQDPRARGCREPPGADVTERPGPMRAGMSGRVMASSAPTRAQDLRARGCRAKAHNAAAWTAPGPMRAGMSGSGRRSTGRTGSRTPRARGCRVRTGGIAVPRPPGPTRTGMSGTGCRRCTQMPSQNRRTRGCRLGSHRTPVVRATRDPCARGCRLRA